MREIDLLRVKGKKDPVVVFELLARKGQVEEKKRRVIDVYLEGLAAYKVRNFSIACAFAPRIALELDRRGVDVRVGCIWGTDITEPPTGDPRVEQLRHRPKDTSLVQVVYHQGDSLIKNSGRYRIGYTMRGRWMPWAR